MGTVLIVSSRIQVNDLSTGLLALLLLPLLSKSADIPLPAPAVAAFKPHLCIVGSEGQSLQDHAPLVLTPFRLIVHGFAKFEESHAMGSTLTALNRKGTSLEHNRVSPTDGTSQVSTSRPTGTTYRNVRLSLSSLSEVSTDSAQS